MSKVYFDTSAMMRLLLRDRAGHADAMRAWRAADQVSSVRVTYAETRAALARVRRARDLGARRHARLKTIWDTLWPDLDIVEVDQPLMVHAGQLAERHALRGYDAVQLAAVRKSGCQFLVSADNQLSAAADRLRISVLDLN